MCETRHGRVGRVSSEDTYTGSALLAGVPTRFTMAFLGAVADAPDHSAQADIPSQLSKAKQSQ